MMLVCPQGAHSEDIGRAGPGKDIGRAKTWKRVIITNFDQ